MPDMFPWNLPGFSVGTVHSSITVYKFTSIAKSQNRGKVSCTTKNHSGKWNSNGVFKKKERKLLGKTKFEERERKTKKGYWIYQY